MKASSLINGMPKHYVLINKNKVPDYNNVNFLHNCMCHGEKTYRNCDNCIQKDYNVAKLLSSVNKDADEHNTVERNGKLPYEALKLSSFLKICALFLLVCDGIYLHISLQSIKESLRNTTHTIENLESQLKFTKLNYETFKADINYLMYLNRMFTKDINSKIELLIQLNKMFVDRTDTSLNSIVNILRNKKNNSNEIRRIVNKRKLNGLTSNLETSKADLYNEKYSVNEIGLESVNNGDNNFNNVLNGNNNSSYNNYDFENDRIDPELILGNTTISTKLLLSSNRNRSKRQTSNSSRSNNRGKHHNSKSKNRGHHRHTNCNLFCCSSGPLLAHFRGAQPEALIQDGGSVIAPWFEDLSVSGDYLYRSIQLREGKAKIEVTEKGLYLIYAQVYYLTSSQLNSFSINIQTEKEVTERVVALCSTEAAVQDMSEVSCYTSVVHQLGPGDKVFLIQRERYRRVIFREGHTFLGLVALNNPPKC